MFDVKLVLIVVVLSTYFFLAAAAGPQQAPFHPSPPPGRSGIQILKEVEQEVFRLTNEVRRQQGLPPLAPDQALSGAARQHSADMLARRYFSHVTPEGQTLINRLPPGYAPVISSFGENIWLGSGQDLRSSRLLAQTIMQGLMASPGHRENILNPRYTHLGVGVAAGGRETRATQLFVQKSPQVR
jgi:uncharacterized protein YkwD